MAKLFGGLTCRLLSRRSLVWLSSSTPTRFCSYHYCLSQAESSCFDNYIQRWQNLLSPRNLSSPAYPLCLQSYREDLAAEACVESRGSKHVQATPLLDVLYVSVESNKCDDFEREERPPLEIYGIIQLIDEQNHTYDVYRRESNNPEIVSHGGNLSLTRPDGTLSSLFLPCVSALKMRVHLRDAAAEGKGIAMGDFDMQVMDKTCYHDKIKTEVVDGHDGFASVQYATLPYGVIANVELRLTKNDETGSDQSHALIYGTISASSKLKNGSIINVLFNRAPSEPIMVDLGAPIKLCRDKLGVPAYSCIQIKTDLWDHHTNQQIASDVIVGYFDADHANRVRQNLDLGQNYNIKVNVTWDHAYEDVFEGSGYPIEDQKLLCGQLRSLAAHRLTKDLDCGLPELPESYPSMSYFPLILVEVFSISISLHNDATSRICGTIKVYDPVKYGENSYCIFEKNNSNPEILDGAMKIKYLKWPSRPIKGLCFGMDLHLTDDVGLEVCKGFFDWNEYLAGFPIARHDKRVSSVIRGQHGYATVHYAFFDRAIIAKVKVVFIPNRSLDVSFKISGDIVARYSTFIYSTYSEKMFFQSTLFGDNHHIILAGGSPLVLQKEVVSVPYGSSLIVDVKLRAQVICEFSEGTRLEDFGSLDEVVDVNVDVDETCIRRIDGEDFHVDVFVEWIST